METGAENGVDASNVGEGASVGQKKVKLHIGQNGPTLFKHGMEVRNPMRAGLSESVARLPWCLKLNEV